MPERRLNGKKSERSATADQRSSVSQVAIAKHRQWDDVNGDMDLISDLDIAQKPDIAFSRIRSIHKHSPELNCHFNGTKFTVFFSTQNAFARFKSL